MDSSNKYGWHARANPVDAVWPMVPSLLADELISSWLVRCALAQGGEPTILTHEVWPERRFWCCDSDRELRSEELDALHKFSGISVDTLEASTLRPLQNLMTGGAPFPQGVAPWFLCLGIRNRRRCGGLQYCPHCFINQTPYYRVQDRLAWHTACPIHHVGLLDCCESCQAPLCPQLVVPPAEDLSRCHRCGFDLKMASAAKAEIGALLFQKATDGYFFARPQLYGNRHLAIDEWFSLAKWMLGILRGAARAHSPCTQGFFDGLGVSFEGLSPPPTGLPFEYIAPHDRAEFLANVWSMLQVGPEALIELARRECISPSMLLPRSGKLPASLTELLIEQKKPQRQNTPQVSTGKPRSSKDVLMRWRRLLRKFQR